MGGWNGDDVSAPSYEYRAVGDKAGDLIEGEPVSTLEKARMIVEVTPLALNPRVQRRVVGKWEDVPE